MQSETKEREAIRQYLLRQASPEDASHVEERLLTDDAFYDELDIVEAELIDQYVGGDLSESERETFETHFLLAQEHQRKVRFARNLKKYVKTATASEALGATAKKESSVDAPDEPQPGKRPFFSFLPFGNPAVSYSLAAAVLLIVIGASWMIFKNWKSSPPQAPRNFATVLLSPGLTREGGDEFKQISVPLTVDALRLELLVADEFSTYQKYSGTLKTAEGKIVLTAENLNTESRNGRRIVIFDAPSSALLSGDYKFELSGQTPPGANDKIASYYFRVSAP